MSSRREQAGQENDDCQCRKCHYGWEQRVFNPRLIDKQYVKISAETESRKDMGPVHLMCPQSSKQIDIERSRCSHSLVGAQCPGFEFHKRSCIKFGAGIFIAKTGWPGSEVSASRAYPLPIDAQGAVSLSGDLSFRPSSISKTFLYLVPRTCRRHQYETLTM